MSISAKMASWSERPGMVSIILTAFGVLVSNISRMLFLRVCFRLDWRGPASSRTESSFFYVILRVWPQAGLHPIPSRQKVK